MKFSARMIPQTSIYRRRRFVHYVVYDLVPTVPFGTYANMEGCLALLPRKSYNKYGFLCLALFVSAGFILIGIASNFDSKATLQCNPDKTLASDLSKTKYIGTQCLLKYAQKFHPSLPLEQPINDKFRTCALTQYYLRLLGKRSCGNLC